MTRTQLTTALFLATLTAIGCGRPQAASTLAIRDLPASAVASNNSDDLTPIDGTDFALAEGGLLVGDGFVAEVPLGFAVVAGDHGDVAVVDRPESPTFGATFARLPETMSHAMTEADCRELSERTASRQGSLRIDGTQFLTGADRQDCLVRISGTQGQGLILIANTSRVTYMMICAEQAGSRCEQVLGSVELETGDEAQVRPAYLTVR